MIQTLPATDCAHFMSAAAEYVVQELVVKLCGVKLLDHQLIFLQRFSSDQTLVPTSVRSMAALGVG